jgi:hypothetical protein
MLGSSQIALAQTSPTTPDTRSSTTGTTTAAPDRTRSTDTRPSDRAAASGNNNQAVATTDANAPQPARGANSFTQGEAKSRIEKNGFSGVSDLTKDDNGVWRGKANKGGQTTSVWLDYKGNVGSTH